MPAVDLPPPAIHQLAPCPERPNCVSSLAEDERHRVEPLALRGSADESLARLRRIVEEMPGAKVSETGEGYLRAEFRSRIFRFVDDLELLADPAAGVVHVRSASRVGYSDLGVNRRRVQQIRSRYRPPG